MTFVAEMYACVRDFHADGKENDKPGYGLSLAKPTMTVTQSFNLVIWLQVSGLVSQDLAAGFRLIQDLCPLCLSPDSPSLLSLDRQHSVNKMLCEQLQLSQASANGCALVFFRTGTCHFNVIMSAHRL